MFFRPNKALLLADKKLKSTCKSLELTTAIRLPTVIHHTVLLSCMTSYKDYDQTSTNNNQPTLDQPTVLLWWISNIWHQVSWYASWEPCCSVM